MESSGAKALDYKKTTVNKGDIIIMPSNNSNLWSFPMDTFQTIGIFELMPGRWLATEQKSVGAGFYWGGHGPLPFVFGETAPERYFIYRAGASGVFR